MSARPAGLVRFRHAQRNRIFHDASGQARRVHLALERKDQAGCKGNWLNQAMGKQSERKCNAVVRRLCIVMKISQANILFLLAAETYLITSHPLHSVWPIADMPKPCLCRTWGMSPAGQRGRARPSRENRAEPSRAEPSRTDRAEPGRAELIGSQMVPLLAPLEMKVEASRR